MKARSERNNCLRCVKEFVCRLNIPDVLEHINDDEFMMEKVFPLANEKFISEYWRYRSAEHYLQNREFYDNPDNYRFTPGYV